MLHKFSGLDGDYARDPRWSPDSKRIVWSWLGGLSQSNGWDITADDVQSSPDSDWLAGAGPCGCGDHSLVAWNGDQRRPEYSPQGTKLAFDSTSMASGVAYSDGQPRVFTANADGSSPAEITVGADPTYSRDGTRIAFQKPPKSGAPTQIYVVASTGGTVTRLTSNRFTDSSPQWSTDGSRIYFSRTDSTGCSLWSMTPTGTNQVKVVSGCRGSGRQASVATDQSLLERYAPQLRYDAQEQYFAGSAASITDNLGGTTNGNTLQREDGSVLASANANTGQQLTLGLLSWPSYSNGVGALDTDRLDEVDNYAADAARFDADPAYANKTYGRIKRDGAGRLWLQYYLWYYYNPWTVLTIGAHEGDWEMIQLRLDFNGAPEVATFSQHKDEDAESCVWSRVQRTWTAMGPVPTVYVAEGSHASYFTPGDHYLGEHVADVNDHADGTGRSVHPAMVQIADASPGWVAWQGKWGASGNSPRGPVRQGTKWSAPDTFDAQAGACEAPAGTARRTRGRNAPPTRVRKSRSPLLAPRAPRVSARQVGDRIVVDYRLTLRASRVASRPRRVLIAAHSTNRLRAPTVARVIVRRGRGRVSLPIPRGAGPYRVTASALSGRLARSRVVTARVGT